MATYLKGLQQEMGVSGGGYKLTENSVQDAIARLQLKESRKTAEFLCSKWTDEDVQMLLGHRAKVAQVCSSDSRDGGSAETRAMEDECRALLLAYTKTCLEGTSSSVEGMVQRRKELLMECMSRDIFCVERYAEGRENGQSAGDEKDGESGMQVEAIFDMLNEKYGMHEVDALANKRQCKLPLT